MTAEKPRRGSTVNPASEGQTGTTHDSDVVEVVLDHAGGVRTPRGAIRHGRFWSVPGCPAHVVWHSVAQARGPPCLNLRIKININKTQYGTEVDLYLLLFKITDN